jgi:hypothetical protein
MAELIWEIVHSGEELFVCRRAKVPGGWLVIMGARRYDDGDVDAAGLTFVPDPRHEWT